MKKIVGNVGILDLREATEERIADFDQFINVGVVVYSPKTAVLVNKLNFKNLGCRAEVPENAKLVTGELEINHDYFKSIKEPQAMVVTGQVFVHSDVTVQEIETNLDKMIVMGQIIAPASLMPVLQSKVSSLQGSSLTYADDSLLLRGTIEVNDSFLNGLNARSTLSFFNRMIMSETITASLFEEKIEKIDLIGRAVIREEYAELINKKLMDSSKRRITVIPAGFDYLSQRLDLDALVLKRLGKVSIYTTESIIIRPDVTAEALRAQVDAIICKKRIFCPVELKETVLELCKDPTVKILTYAGKLIIIDGEYELTSAELEYAEGVLSLEVAGELCIDTDVDPELLIKKIHVLDNFGCVNATARQLGALKVKTRVNEGEFVDADKQKQDSDERFSIANAGYLKL